VRAIGETVTLELAGPTSWADDESLAALSAAAQTQTRVRLRYQAGGRAETEREFDPYGLVYRKGCWYVAGMCHLRRGLRTFRLDRVREVTPLDVGFARPEGFDALEHLVRSVATMPRAFAVEVLLLTDPEKARRELSVALGILTPAPDGVLLESHVDDLAWLARELARLPFGLRVRRPPELADALRLCARRILESAAR